MGISEEDLPGIGRRYELDVRDRARVVVVEHNDGMRDLFAFGDGASEPSGAFHVDDATARQLGAILIGTYYRPAFVEPITSIIDRFHLRAVPIREGSALSGRSIEVLQIRERAGVTVVAVVSDSATLVDPQPSTVLEPGDRVVVAGTIGQLHAFEQLAAESPLASATDHEERPA